MDDLNEELHPDYLKGFNEGYLIAENLPTLAEKLNKVKGDSMQLLGLRHGIEQFDKEKTKDLPAWLKKDRQTSLDKDSEKDKDEKEKE